MSKGSPRCTGVANGSGKVRSTVGAGVGMGVGLGVGLGSGDGVGAGFETVGIPEAPVRGEPLGAALEHATASAATIATPTFNTLPTPVERGHAQGVTSRPARGCERVVEGRSAGRGGAEDLDQLVGRRFLELVVAAVGGLLVGA